MYDTMAKILTFLRVFEKVLKNRSKRVFFGTPKNDPFLTLFWPIFGSKMGSVLRRWFNKSARNGNSMWPKMAQKWSKNGPKIVSNFGQKRGQKTRKRVFSVFFKSDKKMTKKKWFFPLFLRNFDPFLTQIWPKFDPNYDTYRWV